jgi:L-alanine-DL-glutamate epimerase-like enolase superfamily enzyme
MAGFIQSRRIAAPAEPYEMNISPHNANSYLSTFITAHACASVPDVRIIGIGVDRTQWPR